MKTETFQDMYLRELRDVYGSELMLAKWLPKLIEKVRAPALRNSLTQQVAEVRVQQSRLEQIFQVHGEKPSAKTSKGFEGILKEADDDLAIHAEPSVRDAAVVAAMEQIKHYEIAAYGSLQSYAVHLGHREAAKLLQETLDEERTADRNLMEIALRHTQVEAA